MQCLYIVYFVTQFHRWLINSKLIKEHLQIMHIVVNNVNLMSMFVCDLC
uniref:Uncharacterized protein n=1 Tax=Anguilla anguilla TaxID=7936 RepID=A0A0E9TJZ2_ANGAN